MRRYRKHPLLESEHVRIRVWDRRDTSAQQHWPTYSDPFNELWNLPRSTKLGHDFSSLFSSPTNTRRMWAIENHSDCLVGRISLREIDQGKRRARLGISLHASYVSRGLGTEALTLFLDYFFYSLGFSTMVLDVAAFNERAVRCYKRLGFNYVGYEWRSTRNHACLRLLEEPSYHELQPFFRLGRRETLVQFIEMELPKQRWQNTCQHTSIQSHGTHTAHTTHVALSPMQHTP